jgi:putative DNA primase/helicase
VNDQAGSGVAARQRPNLTDAGNAERFALMHKAWYRYVWEWRTGLVWDGKCWSRDPGDGALRFAKATSKAIYHEIEGAPNPDERERIAKWAIASESERRLRAMVALAHAEPGIPVRPDDLDAPPWLLNCQNGTLDLHLDDAGALRPLRPHRREDLLTRVIPVAYDPVALCPEFDRFLQRIFVNRPHLIEYIQRAIGYSLTASRSSKSCSCAGGSARTARPR